MGKGKGGEQSTTVELPKEIKEAARDNQQLVRNIAQIPYAPNLGLTTAAFTPQQQAAFQGTQSAAGAFGMPQASGTGLPQAQTVGGFSGYSTAPLYNQSISMMPDATRQALERTLANPWGDNALADEPTSRQSGKGGGSSSRGSGKGGGVSDLLQQRFNAGRS